MTIKGKYVVVLVTAPNVKTGRALARAALTARLVACANLIPSIESHYWWQGKIDRCPEVLLLMKTTAAHLAVLTRHRLLHRRGADLARAGHVIRPVLHPTLPRFSPRVAFGRRAANSAAAAEPEFERVR